MKKKELSEKINEILGLTKKVDFTKLSKKDLEVLYEGVSNVAASLSIGVRSAKAKLRQGLLQRPTREVLNMPLGEFIANIRSEGGLIGILAKIREERRR